MADIDEDAIPRSLPSSNTAQDPDHDPEDEAPDFRFLASLSGTNTSIPKRGEKDFEPNTTKAQQNVLHASREAMHNALSVERVHPFRNTTTGVYLHNPDEWWHDAPSETTAPGARCVVVEKFRGGLNKTIGKEDFRNWTWLLPEEALFLIERGSLDLRWPIEGQTEVIHRTLSEDYIQECALLADKLSEEPYDGGGRLTAESSQASNDERVNGVEIKAKKYTYFLGVSDVPMSLQGAYACLVGKSGLTLERYSVYAGLKRLGYILQRASTWTDDSEGPLADAELYTSPESSSVRGTLPSPSTSSLRPLILQNSSSTSLVKTLFSWLFRPPTAIHQYDTACGPLIKPGIYRSYNDIFRALNLIPTFDIPSNEVGPISVQLSRTPKPPFTIDYIAHKPSSLAAYRKTSPPIPDFYISVLDARTTCMPTLPQIGALLDSLSPDPPQSDKKIEMKLKHGRRNVVLAVVDSGIVSYLRLADMGSAELGKVFEEKARRATKGGGWRGGRGRGGGGRGSRGRGQGRGATNGGRS